MNRQIDRFGPIACDAAVQPGRAAGDDAADAKTAAGAYDVRKVDVAA